MKIAFTLIMAGIIAALVIWGMRLARQIDKDLNNPDGDEE